MSERDRGGRRHHKDLQLCRQVFDALTYALAELDDPQIEELAVASVVPAPSSSRVLVTLVATREDLATDALAAALACIDASANELREEVAAEITRQRVPELVFRIAPRAVLAELA
jgi:ribosome-binding factor A